jgi:hypothetical protein
MRLFSFPKKKETAEQYRAGENERAFGTAFSNRYAPEKSVLYRYFMTEDH